MTLRSRLSLTLLLTAWLATGGVVGGAVSGSRSGASAEGEARPIRVGVLKGSKDIEDPGFADTFKTAEGVAVEGRWIGSLEALDAALAGEGEGEGEGEGGGEGGGEGSGVVDVLYLPSGWAQDRDLYEQLEDRAGAFHAFIERGGGLVVSQPNPYQHPNDRCTPTLLPYAMMFDNQYQIADNQRVKQQPEHPLIRGLEAGELPQASDQVVEWDVDAWSVLAIEFGSMSPSLVVCEHGRGRVVVQTGNDSAEGGRNRSLLKMLHRSILWSAHRLPERGRE